MPRAPRARVFLPLNQSFPELQVSASLNDKPKYGLDISHIVADPGLCYSLPLRSAKVVALVRTEAMPPRVGSSQTGKDAVWDEIINQCPVWSSLGLPHGAAREDPASLAEIHSTSSSLNALHSLSSHTRETEKANRG